MKFFQKVMAACLVSALVSCSSTTVLRSTDSTVKIYADGIYKGTGETSYTDTKIVGSTTQVSLRKEGCRTVSNTISRDGGVHVGALIGGLFFLVPFLWITKYNPAYEFDFECRK